MNALAWLGAAVASLWLTVYLFITLNENALGYASLVVVAICLVTAMAEGWADFNQYWPGKRRGEDE